MKVLVLDDEKHIRQDLSKHLEKKRYGVCTAETVEEANKIIKAEIIDFAIIDLKIDHSSDYGGIKAIENINKIQPKTKIIILSAHAEVTAKEAKELETISYVGYVHKGGPENYILAVMDKLEEIKEKPQQKKCFVIMPFSSTESCTKEQWNEIYEKLIKPAVEKSEYNYKCEKADLVIGNIIKAILDNLNKADVVIADLTDQNPNVFYELGVRHALRDSTILIAQNIRDIPFDLRQYATISYDWTITPGRNEFMKKVKKALAKIENDPNDPIVVSPVREYLQL